ncbi:hypothetical protein CAMRE0001_1735 [Campylobacter rectus RM3267]|uniref:Uncharacterized protein n=1 Tax=Campylobacter rectus RM3267 TaxID=553218 RepID=B9CYC0_CAMRE|nr:hypothetical protein CAMRE0001_1735 [Campylobacter rectus RM3267]
MQDAVCPLNLQFFAVNHRFRRYFKKLYFLNLQILLRRLKLRGPAFYIRIFQI